VARAAHEGPRDYAERAARNLPAAEEPIRRIATLYIALRYGPAGASTQTESVVQLRRMIKIGFHSIGTGLSQSTSRRVNEVL
jgi:hypothetical protein